MLDHPNRVFRLRMQAGLRVFRHAVPLHSARMRELLHLQGLVRDPIAERALARRFLALTQPLVAAIHAHHVFLAMQQHVCLRDSSRVSTRVVHLMHQA